MFATIKRITANYPVLRACDKINPFVRLPWVRVVQYMPNALTNGSTNAQHNEIDMHNLETIVVEYTDTVLGENKKIVDDAYVDYLEECSKNVDLSEYDKHRIKSKLVCHNRAHYSSHNFFDL